MKLFLSLLGLIFLSIPGKGKTYNVLDYGAKADTTVLSTEAINAAIRACYQAGGGRVLIPAGSYKSGTIFLKSNVELHLQVGATLYAATSHSDFPRQAQLSYRSQKDPGGWYALIYAENEENIAVTGKGTIDGNGKLQQPRPQTPGGDLDGRPRNILFTSCRKITVNGVTMLNSGIWNQHYLNCEDVLISDIYVYNHSNRNNDGLDIDGCRRVVVSDCIIDSDDDAIVLKSTGPAGCEDIVISNCILSSYTNALKCGTETTGHFKNISISNCVVRPSKSSTPSFFGLPGNGITAISLEMVDGGILENVLVSNIVIAGTQCPIFVRLGNRARKHHEDASKPPVGQMRNIVISDITAYNTGNYSSSITGVPDGKIEDIILRNINIVNNGSITDGDYIAHYGLVEEHEKSYPEPTFWGNLPSYGFFIRHVGKISLQQVSLRSQQDDPRRALIAVDVDELNVLNVDAGDEGQPSVFELVDVRKKTINGGSSHLIIAKP